MWAIHKLVDDERRAAQARRPVGPAPMPHLDTMAKIDAEAAAIRADASRYDPDLTEAVADAARAQAAFDRATAAEAAASEKQAAGEFVSSTALRKLADATADAAEKLRIEYVAKNAVESLRNESYRRLIGVASQKIWLSAYIAFERAAIATERKNLALEAYENAIDVLEIRRSSLAERLHSWAQAEALLTRDL